MNKILSISFFFIFWLQANVAQEFYQLFEPNDVYLFTDEQGYAHTIRWDSVYIGDATDFFFNYRTFRQLESGQFTDQGISWMGYGIRRFFGGEFSYILIENNEEIQIMIGGETGDEFVMYYYPNGDMINGKIIQIQEEEFLGISDTVKTIEIVKTDSNGNTLSYAYNGFLVKISKHHGLIRGLNFGDFPDGDMQIFSLAGMEKEGLGQQNLRFTEAFSMSPGDKIHVHGHSNFFQNSFDGMYIYDVLEKNFNEDKSQVSLTLKRCAYEIEVVNEEVSERSFNDTTILAYFISLPEEETCFHFPEEYPDIPFGDDPRTYDWQYISDEFNQRRVKGYRELYSQADDEWIQYIDYLCWDYYIEGVGQFYYYEGPGGASYCEPVYYKIGNEEWGEPYDCNDLLATEEIDDGAYWIYPNPFTNKIHIESVEEPVVLISLYDLSGKLIYKNMETRHQEDIDLSHLKSGAYFYIITDRRGTFSGKLIKLD